MHYGIICVLMTIALIETNDVLNVTTPSGDVTGIGVDVIGLKGAKTYQFRKIPFAKPPIGDLRFAKPQPFGTWNDTLDATEFGPSCVQIMDPFYNRILPNVNISEDCLFLNIYIPNGLDKTKNKTVMVWIHGGSYANGEGMLYDASYMAAKSDVIVITINYRLNMFGFPTLGNDKLKGNYGLWDQILALQWVHDNINAFGGDHNSVTIFGESAGGFSVALHALIPSNRGLFQRVIAQSGVANSFFSLTRIGVYATTLVGQAAGCNDTNPDNFLSCLKSKSSDEILHGLGAALASPQKNIHIWLGLGPVVDNELFTDMPENLMKNTSSEAAQFFQSLDLIVGNVNSEGSLVLGAFTPSLEQKFKCNISEGISYNIFCGEVVRTLVTDYYNNNSKVRDAICKEYGVRNNITEQARRLVQMHTDLFFLAPSVSTLNYHAQSNTKTKRLQYIFTKAKIPLSRPPPSWFRGAAHASELVYLFGLRNLVKLNLTVTNEDITLSDWMITYWTTFAKTGNPSTRQISTVWPWYGPDTQTYLTFDDGPSLGYDTDFNNNGVKFWLESIPNILNSNDSTTVEPHDNGTSPAYSPTTSPSTAPPHNNRTTATQPSSTAPTQPHGSSTTPPVTQGSSTSPARTRGSSTAPHGSGSTSTHPRGTGTSPAHPNGTGMASSIRGSLTIALFALVVAVMSI